MSTSRQLHDPGTYHPSYFVLGRIISGVRVFENKIKGDELKPPPIAFSNAQAHEVLRVWTEPNSVNQVVIQTTWADPGAWGLLLADLARHAAKAYASEGHDPQRALDRIKQLLDAELSQPTDSPIELN